jgi:hypothetical protein
MALSLVCYELVRIWKEMSMGTEGTGFFFSTVDGRDKNTRNKQNLVMYQERGSGFIRLQ